MATKCIRIITGEDLIGDITLSEDGFFLLIKNPLMIMMQQGENGNIGVGFVPFLPFSKTKQLEVAPASVVLQYEPAESLANAYASATGGLVIAQPADVPPPPSRDTAIGKLILER